MRGARCSGGIQSINQYAATHGIPEALPHAFSSEILPSKRDFLRAMYDQSASPLFGDAATLVAPNGGPAKKARSYTLAEHEALKGRQVVKCDCWGLKRAGLVGRKLIKIELGPAEN